MRFRSASCCRTSAFWKACPTASCCSTPTTRSSGATAACASGPGARASSARTSTPCWAAPRFWAPISVRSTRRWPPAAPAVRRCGRPTIATSRCTPRRCSKAATGAPQNLIVTIRDVTTEMLQQQKLAAIHQAGIELADLTPDELSEMTVEERIELLKTNILHFTKDLLHFDVVEIRLLDGRTGKLEPLLAVGITRGRRPRPVRPAAEQRRDRLRRRHRQELSVRGHHAPIRSIWKGAKGPRAR